MKNMINNRYFPRDNNMELYNSYRNYNQGTRSVSKYSVEFLRLQSRCKLRETEEQQVSN